MASSFDPIAGAADDASAATAAMPYTGVGNLEVMAEARNYNRFLTDLVRTRLTPGACVLDFGAGAGTFAAPLREQGVDITAIEPDARLRARLGAQGVPVLATIDGLADGSVDLIYSFNVLEHIADDRTALRALGAKLKRGGQSVLYVPAFQMLFTAMDRRVGHLRRYRRGGLTDLVAAAGLRVRTAQYVDSLGALATLLYRVAGDGDGEINRAALRLYDRLVFPLSRALDRLLWPWLGKNLLIVASKD